MNKIVKSMMVIVLLNMAAGLNAQQNHPLPDQMELQNYLVERCQKIQDNLFEKAQNGEFTLYKTDSLKSTYNLKEFKMRWAKSYLNIDTMVPLGKEDMMSLRFLKSYSNSIFSEKESSQWTGIAITFQPVLANMPLPEQPLVWLKTEELKKQLPDSDYQFLVLLFQYSSNSNCYKWYWEYDNFPFMQLNIEKTMHIQADTALFKRVSGMIASSHFYIEHIGLFLSVNNPDKYMVMDEQGKRRIPIHDIGLTYKEIIPIFISTDENDPTKGYDSTYTLQKKIEKINTVTFEEKSGKITQYNCEIPGNAIGQMAKFSIYPDFFKGFEASELMVWYIEDYLRWKLAQKTSKK